VNSNYRNYSSAWSGQAPRHMAQRWPDYPVSYQPTRTERLMAALKRLIVAVSGQPDRWETK
jgi:hypothetical protein